MPDTPFDPLLAPLLRRFSDLLASRLGLHFPPERHKDLVRRLSSLPSAGGDLRGCLEHFLAAPADARDWEALASHLTIGETYFFREPQAFAALEEHLLPPLIRARASGERRLRLWSAGCASGEEAYSLAMVADRVLPVREGWKIDVLGTDINPEALARAVHGVYGPWSFRAPLPEWQARCFADAGGRRAVVPGIRALVSFAHLNLASEAFPAPETGTDAMDVIFCRNVLMYFRPDVMKAVVGRLVRCLNDGGWLVTSAVESSLVAREGLVAERLPGLIYFRKEGKAAAKAAPAHRRKPQPAPRRAATPRGGAAMALRRPPPEAADSLAERAHALAGGGRLEEALACCEQAVAAEKLDPGHTYLQASILLELGRLDAAAAALRRTLYLDPERPLAHFALANLFARSGRQADSHRHYREARMLLERLPGDAPLPDSGGVPAGSLLDVVAAILGDQGAA